MKNLIKALSFVFGVALLAAGQAQAASTVTYYHHDALGSVIASSHEDGYVNWNEEYQPYGEKIYDTVDNDGGSEDFYTGKNYNSDIDLTYFGARWYDAKQGRFISMDPAPVKLENIHSFNRYVYANNNPYKFIDPDGEESFLVSRSLSFTDSANHNFIVNNATFLGDPNATVISFGDIGNDTTGRVSAGTDGFSEGTNKTDREAWESLRTKAPKATFRKINIEDSIVGRIAGSLIENTNYSAYPGYLPDLQSGPTTNSNSAAGAVAKRADGGSPRVNNGKNQPGSDVSDRIKFSID